MPEILKSSPATLAPTRLAIIIVRPAAKDAACRCNPQLELSGNPNVSGRRKTARAIENAAVA